MSDAIAVLNAGSSSLKFSLFAGRGDALELTARGQTEGLYTAPRFVAKDRHGKTLGEKFWGDGLGTMARSIIWSPSSARSSASSP